MRKILLAALLSLCACSSGTGDADDDAGVNPDGGHPDGGPNDAWTLQSITGADDKVDFDMARAPDGRIGVVYYHRIDTHTFGTEPDYELRYIEWKDGNVGEPEVLRVSQRMNGLDLAFQSNGQPIVAYIGGDTPTDVSLFWHQSDAALARRNADGTWTEEVVATLGNEATAGNPVSDRGFLVGLFPALALDGDTAFFAWRDCHDGQFPQQDWNASDLEFATGSSGSWQKSVVIAGGDNKQAWGGHLQMVATQGQPAIVSDQVFGTADATGSNLIFSRRQANGTWATPVRPIENIGSTQSGPSLDWDATLGFAIAVVDRAEDKLMFTRSINDGKTWTDADPVYQSGSGGWYPSLSINPVTHDPSIAFYICADSGGANEGTCKDADDRLMVTERIANIWRDQIVDQGGAWRPKMDHTAEGKRVIVYRNPKDGAIKLAVEK